MWIPNNQYKEEKRKFFNKLGFVKNGYSYHELSLEKECVSKIKPGRTFNVCLGFDFWTREVEMWIISSRPNYIKLETTIKHNMEIEIQKFIDMCDIFINAKDTPEWMIECVSNQEKNYVF